MPWLSAEKRGLAALLLSSHQRAFGMPLIATARPGQSTRLCCQELFSSSFPVLAHGIDDDPLVVYANAAALQLWGRRWADMVGMPSKLTAPDEVHGADRSTPLSFHTKSGVRGYGGVRID